MALHKSRIALMVFIIIIVAIAIILIATGKVPGVTLAPSGKCTGAAICPANLTLFDCTGLGCKLTTISNRTMCMGVPKPCNNYTSISACEKVPGCFWMNITTPPAPPKTPSLT